MITGLLFRRREPLPSAPAVAPPVRDSAPFPAIALSLLIVTLLIAIVFFPRGGAQPLSSTSDRVIVRIEDAQIPHAFWSVTPTQDSSYALDQVRLVVNDLGETATDLSLNFDGEIANAVLSCAQGVGDYLGPSPKVSFFTSGSESPLDYEQVEAARAKGEIRSVGVVADLAWDEVVCAIDPKFVYSTNGPERVYAFPRIVMVGDVPLHEDHEWSAPLFSFDSGLYTGTDDSLPPDTTVGSFFVPAEVEKRTVTSIVVGLLFGLAGGFSISVVAWFDSTRSRRREEKKRARDQLADDAPESRTPLT